MQRRSNRTAPPIALTNEELASLERANRANKKNPPTMAEEQENPEVNVFDQMEQMRADNARQTQQHQLQMELMQQHFTRQMELMQQGQQNQPLPPPQRGIGEGDNVHAYYQNRSAIRAPEIQRNDFEIKAHLINLVERHLFHGLSAENPMDHIENFEEVCETTKSNGVPSDYLKCKLFKHSLADKALRWLKSLPPNSLNGWEEARAAFLDHFYTKSKTAQLRNRISSFTQKGGESFAEAWDRFKEYRRECPHHGFSEEQMLRTFYDGATWEYKNSLNSSSNGDFMTQTTQGAYKLIENMAQSSSTQCPEYDRSKKVYNVEALPLAELAELTAAKLKDLIQPGQQGMSMTGTEEICYAEDTAINSDEPQEINYVNNQGFGQNRVFNNNYRNHPNFSYRSTNVANPQDQVYPQQALAPAQKQFTNPSGPNPTAPGFAGQNQGYQRPPFQGYQQRQYGQNSGPGYQNNANQGQHNQSAASPIEELRGMMQLMLANQQKTVGDISAINGRLETVTTHLKVLDTQVAQQAEAVKRQQGTLPARGEQNPKKDCFAISVEEVEMAKEEENAVTKECRDVSRKGTVEKLGDPGRFIIPVQIGSEIFPRSLCDSGSSVNTMPYSVAERLGFKDFSPSEFSLRFADYFIQHPIGILKDVQLLIGDVFVPADFVVLDLAEEPGDPLILGRPFLCTAGAKIDVKHGIIDLQLGDTEMIFEIDKRSTKPLMNGKTFSLGEPNNLTIPTGQQWLLKYKERTRAQSDRQIISQSFVPKEGAVIPLDDPPDA